MALTSCFVMVVAVFLLRRVEGSAGSTCEDIDPLACQSMAQQNANLCEDPILAKTACPKLCNNCPLVCYSCNVTTSIRSCNTVTCAAGETCLTARDPTGAQQFTLRCADKSLCGSAGLISCCSKPLCYDPHILITTPVPTTTPTTTPTTRPTTTPTTTTTTKTTIRTTTRKPTTTAKPACHRDIILVVDESNAMYVHWPHVKAFVIDLIDRMPIGSGGARLSFTTFTTTYNNRWHLNSYHDAAHLKHAVSKVAPHGGSWADNLIGTQYLNYHALSSSYGNRRDAPNVAIVISEGHLHHMNPFIASQTQYTEMSALHRNFNNVIAIGIGSSVDSTQISLMATGSSHKFLIRSGSYLKGIENKVYSLICR